MYWRRIVLSTRLARFYFVGTRRFSSSNQLVTTRNSSSTALVSVWFSSRNRWPSAKTSQPQDVRTYEPVKSFVGLAARDHRAFVVYLDKSLVLRERAIPQTLPSERRATPRGYLPPGAGSNGAEPGAVSHRKIRRRRDRDRGRPAGTDHQSDCGCAASSIASLAPMLLVPPLRRGPSLCDNRSPSVASALAVRETRRSPGRRQPARVGFRNLRRHPFRGRPYRDQARLLRSHIEKITVA